MKTEITPKLLLKNGFIDLEYGCFEIDLQTHWLQLAHVIGEYYPSVGQYPEFSFQTDNIVMLAKIDSIEDIEVLIKLITGNEKKLLK